MSITPYLRPDLDQTAEQLPLYITGKLAGGKPGDAYEGRLQIHNQIGACVVLSVTGDDLPVGGTVSIDGNEIVVAWPAYAEAAAPITNPGFEDGIAGWQGGAGWSTTTDNPIAGTRSAVFKDAPGSSILSSLSRYPVGAGDTINASAAIRQGASSAGNAGAGVRLEFRDAAGALVGHKDGNMVMSASNNAVRPSNVTVNPGDRPASTALVNIACNGLRKRQNRDVWVDSFAWTHTVAAAGINIATTLCFTITIRDSAGRTAPWSGCMVIRTEGPMFFLSINTANGNPRQVRYSDTGLSIDGALPVNGNNGSNQRIFAAKDRLYVWSTGGSAIAKVWDGATWTTITGSPPAAYAGNAAYDESTGTYLLLGEGNLHLSSDGVAFTSKALSTANNQRGFCAANGRIVYAWNNGRIGVSTNLGTTWVDTPTLIFPTVMAAANILHDGVHFWACPVNTSNPIAYSLDGLSWTTVAHPLPTGAASVMGINAAGVILLWSATQVAYTLDKGMNWHTTTAPAAPSYASLMGRIDSIGDTFFFPCNNRIYSYVPGGAFVELPGSFAVSESYMTAVFK